MKSRRPSPVRAGEAGFSLVEMLMAAFIMAIGLLGLTMLQVMSIRGAQGGKSLSIAVGLAEQIMDQVEVEGRATYLNANFTDYSSPTPLNGLKYITEDTVTDYYRIDPATGGAVGATAADAQFTVVMSQTYSAGTTLSDVTVDVTFSDASSGGAPIQRKASVTRRILHG
ncbi:type IV pilus modification PilV family protein [Holophaga foetida]|uniref:type IV pilus modification PilV family protein n=1 Tax=Holophaga foetida TaxID=35839 RepID=UPI0006963E92|nr:prepilin-type N-terminal cleavage/methylation domain-containing protein [Holophaga foetida]